MSNYKILFLDIDGTILTPDNEIQDSTKNAIKQVQQKGIIVFLATGRPLHEILDIGEELQIDSFIGYNGAYAVHKGTDVLREPMDKETIEGFITIIKDNDHEAVLYTNGLNLVTSENAASINQFRDYFHLKQTEPYHPKHSKDILGVSLMNISKKDVPLYESAGNIHLSPINVEGLKEHAYDVIRTKVNKGFAIQQVLKVLGLKNENAIAFGDGMNDKEMLTTVGEGFAMGNAQPELIKYAKHQTTEVLNSGVFNGLKKLGLVE
ncbi:HAD family hydrolase [Salipaludibacillus sp. HK11]|uniref:HAD family hydrolase n=1 Tax=Salipaludibacillus sp. HK11 TaxID=3394320 RepID=UPI0039FCE5C7